MASMHTYRLTGEASDCDTVPKLHLSYGLQMVRAVNFPTAATDPTALKAYALEIPCHSTTLQSKCRQCTRRGAVFPSSGAVFAADAPRAAVQLPVGPAAIALNRGPLYLYWPTHAGSGSVVICYQPSPPTVCFAAAPSTSVPRKNT